MKSIPLFALALLLASPAVAETVEEALAGCHAAPKFEERAYPGEEEIARSNDLRKEAGSPFPAPGVPVIINGKVLDDKCNPVTNAKIEMWQVDNNGKQVKLSDGEDFLGAGRTYSNNLGEYSFLTILPAKEEKGNRAPHLNFGVAAEGFLPLYTRMYFPDYPENDKDAELMRVSKATSPYGVKYATPKGEVAYVYNIQLVAGKKTEDEEDEESNGESEDSEAEDEEEVKEETIPEPAEADATDEEKPAEDAAQ